MTARRCKFTFFIGEHGLDDGVGDFFDDDLAYGSARFSVAVREIVSTRVGNDPPGSCTHVKQRIS